VTIYRAKGTRNHSREQVRSGDAQETRVAELLSQCGIEAGFEKPTCAGALARDYPAEKIERCVQHWKTENERRKAGGKELLKVGYLIDSIMSRNARGFVPNDFETAEERAARLKAEKGAWQRERKAATEKRERELCDHKMRARRALACYETFSEDARGALEEAALRQPRFDSALWRTGLDAERNQGRFGCYREAIWGVIAEWVTDGRAEILLAAIRGGASPS
jgi:hypothetical protein